MTVFSGIGKIQSRIVGQCRNLILGQLPRIQHQLVGHGGQLLHRNRAAIERRRAEFRRELSQAKNVLVLVDARPFRFGIVQIERLPVVYDFRVEILFNDRGDLGTALFDRFRQNGHGKHPRRFGRGSFRGFRRRFGFGRDFRLGRRFFLNHRRFCGFRLRCRFFLNRRRFSGFGSHHRNFGNDRLRRRRFGRLDFLFFFGFQFRRRFGRGHFLHRGSFRRPILAERHGQRPQQQRQRQQTCQ